MGYTPCYDPQIPSFGGVRAHLVQIGQKGGPQKGPQNTCFWTSFRRSPKTTTRVAATIPEKRGDFLSEILGFRCFPKYLFGPLFRVQIGAVLDPPKEGPWVPISCHKQGDTVLGPRRLHAMISWHTSHPKQLIGPQIPTHIYVITRG